MDTVASALSPALPCPWCTDKPWRRGGRASCPKCPTTITAPVTPPTSATPEPAGHDVPPAAPGVSVDAQSRDCPACAGVGNLPSRTWDGTGPECAACGGDGVVEPQAYELELIAELREELRGNRTRAQLRAAGELPADHAQDQRGAAYQLDRLSVLDRHVRELLAEVEAQRKRADLAEGAAKLNAATSQEQARAWREQVEEQGRTIARLIREKGRAA